MTKSRREFVKLSSGAIAASAIPAHLNFSSKRKIAPSDTVNIAVVGVRNIGWANLRSHLRIPGVRCLALCDIDQNVLEERISGTEELSGTRPKGYQDFRKLYENQDLDAVIIGTPDHWHTLLTTYAIDAGLDVYVEKPLANTIEECKILRRAVTQSDRIVQVGQQQRSGQHWVDALDYVKSGAIGKVSVVKAWNYGGSDLPPKPDGPPPAGVDYELWLGPAPKRAFNENRFHGSFRWFWDYAGGKMTDWGVHLIDMVLLGMNATTPKSVVAAGGKFAFPGSAMETPDTLSAVYEFDDFIMIWEHNNSLRQGPFFQSHGVAFYGTKGILFVNRGGWEVYPETVSENNTMAFATQKMPKQYPQRNSRDLHAINFIDCIKSRENPVCDVEIGSHVAVVAHLGNISYRLGKKIYWDSEQYNFVNDTKAEMMGKAQYNNGWILPT